MSNVLMKTVYKIAHVTSKQPSSQTPLPQTTESSPLSLPAAGSAEAWAMPPPPRVAK